MDCGAIGRESHDPAHGVNLTDQMPLADSSNRRVAAHLAKIVGPERQQRNARATACCGACRFTSRMSATYDQNIKHGPAHTGPAWTAQRFT
jgi:hypothetical protein